MGVWVCVKVRGVWGILGEEGGCFCGVLGLILGGKIKICEYFCGCDQAIL